MAYSKKLNDIIGDTPLTHAEQRLIAECGAFAGAVGVPLGLALALAVAREHSIKILTLIYILLFIGMPFVIKQFWQPEDIMMAQSFTAFFFILPFLNGFADFLSYGLTQYCLRRGVQGNVLTAFKWGVVDLIGGLVIFVLLGIAIITYIHFVQTPDGPFMDIAGILTGLRTAPSEYYWMMVMFASTLVPTVLHVTVFILSLGYLIIPRLPFVIACLKSNVNVVHLLGGVLPLCAFVTFAVGVPIQVLYWLVTGVDYAVLLRLLSLFEGYAMWIAGISPL